MKPFQNLYICADQSNLAVKGDAGSSSDGQAIFIDLVKCEDEEFLQCKSDEEITKFFQERFMYILSNQVRFDF